LGVIPVINLIDQTDKGSLNPCLLTHFYAGLGLNDDQRILRVASR
jgi:hypothetical protein